MLTGSVAASFIYYPTTSVTSNKKAESVVKTFRLNKFSVTVRRTFFFVFFPIADAERNAVCSRIAFLYAVTAHLIFSPFRLR